MVKTRMFFPFTCSFFYEMNHCRVLVVLIVIHFAYVLWVVIATPIPVSPWDVDQPYSSMEEPKPLSFQQTQDGIVPTQTFRELLQGLDCSSGLGEGCRMTMTTRNESLNTVHVLPSFALVRAIRDVLDTCEHELTGLSGSIMTNKESFVWEVVFMSLVWCGTLYVAYRAKTPHHSEGWRLFDVAGLMIAFLVPLVSRAVYLGLTSLDVDGFRAVSQKDSWSGPFRCGGETISPIAPCTVTFPNPVQFRTWYRYHTQSYTLQTNLHFGSSPSTVIFVVCFMDVVFIFLFLLFGLMHVKHRVPHPIVGEAEVEGIPLVDVATDQTLPDSSVHG